MVTQDLRREEDGDEGSSPETGVARWTSSPQPWTLPRLWGPVWGCGFKTPTQNSGSDPPRACVPSRGSTGTLRRRHPDCNRVGESPWGLFRTKVLGGCVRRRRGGGVGAVEGHDCDGGGVGGGTGRGGLLEEEDAVSFVRETSRLTVVFTLGREGGRF